MHMSKWLIVSPFYSDMVVASPRAVFGLPEASRGLYAAAGGLARIVRICGLQVGSEIAMAGRKLSAEEALRFNVINKISKTHQSVVEETVGHDPVLERLGHGLDQIEAVRVLEDEPPSGGR